MTYSSAPSPHPQAPDVPLPATGRSPLRTLLGGRRSTKDFGDRPISLTAVSELMSIVGGTTDGGHRAQPAALAEYRVEAVLAAGRVTDLEAGTYRYRADGHRLDRIAPDPRSVVAAASLDAAWLADVPAALLLAADLAAADDRFCGQATDQGTRFVCMELGALAQTVYLWAASRDLGTALIAGLDREHAAQAAAHLFPAGHELLAVMPIGYADTAA